MTSQPGQKIIIIHILLNISRNKVNQTMKFGQLKDCNIRKESGKARTRLFYKKSKFSTSLNQQFKML